MGGKYHKVHPQIGDWGEIAIENDLLLCKCQCSYLGSCTMQNTYMYKIKKKIHEQAIHIPGKSFFSYWSCLLIVYLLGFFSSETNTTAASAAGRGDKKSWKCQESSPRNSSTAGGHQGAGNPLRKSLCGSML